jgi:membrane protease YdiL (CAAX protease family)
MIALPARQAGSRLRGPAARVTGLILGAALLRAVVLPLGDRLSTLVFGGCLLAIAWSESAQRPAESRWGRGVSIAAGLSLGLLLVIPMVGGAAAGRPIQAFWAWGAVVAVIATLEEVAIRGRLQQQWTREVGPLSAIIIGAVVFAAIHLPRYGISAMPLDFSVGLALGGLRALTGRVMPSAIAHVMADWGAWFWA